MASHQLAKMELFNHDLATLDSSFLSPQMVSRMPIGLAVTMGIRPGRAIDASGQNSHRRIRSS